MKNIKFKESFNNCRASIYKPETRQFLLSRIAGSEQEKDMSVPSNCDGYGRMLSQICSNCSWKVGKTDM